MVSINAADMHKSLAKVKAVFKSVVMSARPMCTILVIIPHYELLIC